ncbi:MAG: HEAT repeat domain-containing protein [Kiritimatiellae bacterium]|nr:HEAT repeat domain-containing protein [Kiritimatiellia bacterium]
MKQRVLKIVLGVGLSLGVGLTGLDAEAKLKVGLFMDNRTVAIPEITRALTEQGLEVGTFTTQDASAGKIYQFDVLFFGGGWSAYDWLDLSGRMHVVEFAQARGGGVIFSMFRCGWASRSGIRPIFPEVAAAYNKVNGPGLVVVDRDHPITKGLPEKFMTPYMDHAVMRLGPNGRALALDNSQEITIACGAVGLGKVVYLGPWIGVDQDGNPSYPLPPCDATLLLNSVRWVTADPFRKTGGDNAISAEIKLKVLRQKKILDWTHDERGISYDTGIITKVMYLLEEQLDDLLFRSARLLPYADKPADMTRLIQTREKLVTLKNQLQNNYAQARQQKIAQIMLMTVAELEQDKVKNWEGQLLFPHQIQPIEDDVICLEGLLAGTIKAQKARVAAEEQDQDRKRLAQLCTDLQAKDGQTRAEAAQELGRIGDPGSIKALLGALKDSEYPVRRNAIYALGWLQAKEAVPALLALAAQTPDICTKRRVVEALGLIGDRDAVDTLLAALKDSDRFVRQNAILSLGWLGDPRAVAPLTEVLKAPLERVGKGAFFKQDQETGWTREDMVCALRALGHIGDQTALPAIRDFLAQRKEGIPPRNWYVTGLSIDEAVALAIKGIEAGGRKESGVRQPAEFSRSANFYWLSKHYNALYGRPFSYASYPKDWKIRGDYAAASGASGFIEDLPQNHLTGGGWTKKEMVPVNDVLDYYFKQGMAFIPGWYRRGTAVLDKASFEHDILRWGEYPALKGFWAEEQLRWDSELRNDQCFREYLAKKYDAKERMAFGIKDLAGITCPPVEDNGQRDNFLWAEYMEYLADTGVEIWQEAAEWLTGLRKGTCLLFSLSGRYINGKSTYINAYPRLSQVLGANGPQSYGAHSYMNNFHLDLECNGEPKPALGEFYQHQADVPGSVERGFASSFIHGQCFFVWWWGHVFKHAPDGNGGCGVFDPGRWEAAERQFGKGRAIGEFLIPAESPKLVVQLFSGRTTTLTYGKGSPDGIGSGRMQRYSQNQEGVWESLIQSHLPVDLCWLETMTPEKMSRYKVAILADGASLKREEVTMIREWVKAGGVLVAGGGTSVRDQWNTALTNYALSDVFGVDYVKTTLAGSPAEAYRYVERDVKPTNGIEKITFRAPDYLKHLEGQAGGEYEKGLGYDEVKPTTGPSARLPSSPTLRRAGGGAKVVGVWDDGAGAVFENEYGQGHCIFMSPVYLGLSHTTCGWTVDPLYNEYWTGAREMVAACVRRGLDLAQAQLPMEVRNCPALVEVALKRQADKQRWMVHLLNINYKQALVTGVEVSVRVPAGQALKEITYVYPGKAPVAHRIDDRTIKFTVRDFAVHEMIVVEWK